MYSCNKLLFLDCCGCVLSLEYLNCLRCEGEDMATWYAPSGQRSSHMESGRHFARYGGIPGVLEEIALKCGFKVV
jgi:hypothetical protein